MFTATIHTHNKRDAYGASPKVLLTGITKDGVSFRDHAWVEINIEIANLIATTNPRKQTSLLITFLAKPKDYMYRGEVFKRTLKKVRGISILKRQA